VIASEAVSRLMAAPRSVGGNAVDA